MEKNILIAIADSNLMACQLIAHALQKEADLVVMASAVTESELLEAVQASTPDVALIGMHLQTGTLSGLTALRRLHLQCPSVPAILMIDRTEPQLVVDAFRAGAKGVFSRSQSDIGLLCKCIRRILEGQIWVDNTQLLYLLDALSNPFEPQESPTPEIPLLTPREISVVRLVAEGMGNRDIARTLKLSEHTVKNYLFHIFEKLGLSSRVELVLWAVAKMGPDPDLAVAPAPASSEVAHMS